MHAHSSRSLQVDIAGVQPQARRAAASCVVSNRWLLIHGGFDGAGCLADLHALDTQNGVWIQPAAAAPGPDLSCSIGPRALHTLCPVAHGVLVFGGASSGVVHSSVHMLHNAALTDGLKMQLQLQQAGRRHVELQDQLGKQAQSALAAQIVADQARAEGEVLFLGSEASVVVGLPAANEV